MKFQILVEYDRETHSYAATVTGLPIFVDADSEDEAVKLATEAIEFHFESSKGRRRSPQAARPGKAKQVTVEI